MTSSDLSFEIKAERSGEKVSGSGKMGTGPTLHCQFQCFLITSRSSKMADGGAERHVPFARRLCAGVEVNGRAREGRSRRLARRDARASGVLNIVGCGEVRGEVEVLPGRDGSAKAVFFGAT